MRQTILWCFWAFFVAVDLSTESVLRNDSVPFAPELQALIKKDKEVCMTDLGCFKITDEFKHMVYRPINVLPNDRATINTRCLLYTNKNPKEYELLRAHDKESFTNSNINPKSPTKFIVHGFMDNELFGPWMVRMKDEFLMHGDYNIIIVDWSGGNKPPYYQAASNTRVVGAEMALIINALEKFMKIPPKDVHVIGHSLGAHIAGYCGERVKKLGRITACDAAEPYFQHMPKSVRIDASDADYVDAIHSDATTILLLGLGMSEMIGHIDFFPNNGRKQPGCKSAKITSFITDGLTEGTRRFASCNHQRSLDFMHYSINYHKVVPVAYECADWDTFLAGKCADCGSDTKKCAIMGVRAEEYRQFRNSSVQRALYLKTSAKAPFWLYHYQVSVKLFKPRTSYKDQKGAFEVNLHGSKEDFLAKLQNDDVDLYHGSRYQFLVTTDKELGTVKSVTLQWTSKSYNPIKLIIKPKIFVEYVTVVPMNELEKSPRNMEGRTFCAKPELGIQPKEIISYHTDSCK